MFYYNLFLSAVAFTLMQAHASSTSAPKIRLLPQEYASLTLKKTTRKTLPVTHHHLSLAGQQAVQLSFTTPQTRLILRLHDHNALKMQSVTRQKKFNIEHVHSKNLMLCVVSSEYKDMTYEITLPQGCRHVHIYGKNVAIQFQKASQKLQSSYVHLEINAHSAAFYTDQDIHIKKLKITARDASFTSSAGNFFMKHMQCDATTWNVAAPTHIHTETLTTDLVPGKNIFYSTLEPLTAMPNASVIKN